jgi:hypothetical protein
MMVFREVSYDVIWFRMWFHINIVYQGVNNFIYNDNVLTAEFFSIESNQETATWSQPWPHYCHSIQKD